MQARSVASKLLDALADRASIGGSGQVFQTGGEVLQGRRNLPEIGQQQAAVTPLLPILRQQGHQPMLDRQPLLRVGIAAMDLLQVAH